MCAFYNVRRSVRIESILSYALIQAIHRQNNPCSKDLSLSLSISLPLPRPRYSPKKSERLAIILRCLISCGARAMPRPQNKSSTPLGFCAPASEKEPRLAMDEEELLLPPPSPAPRPDLPSPAAAAAAAAAADAPPPPPPPPRPPCGPVRMSSYLRCRMLYSSRSVRDRCSRSLSDFCFSDSYSRFHVSVSFSSSSHLARHLRSRLMHSFSTVMHCFAWSSNRYSRSVFIRSKSPTRACRSSTALLYLCISSTAPIRSKKGASRSPPPAPPPRGVDVEWLEVSPSPPSKVREVKVNRSPVAPLIPALSRGPCECTSL